MNSAAHRLIEALIFAAPQPISRKALAKHLPDGTAIEPILYDLAEAYTARGVTLVEIADGYCFRTAPDLRPALAEFATTTRKPSRAAMEMLAIIAYHQPVTRSEIEAIRGVSLAQGAMSALLQAGWIKPAGRRETPGRPLLWATTPLFLNYFGLKNLAELPRAAELKAAGLTGGKSLPLLDSLTERGD